MDFNRLLTLLNGRQHKNTNQPFTKLSRIADNIIILTYNPNMYHRNTFSLHIAFYMTDNDEFIQYFMPYRRNGNSYEIFYDIRRKDAIRRRLETFGNDIERSVVFKIAPNYFNIRGTDSTTLHYALFTRGNIYHHSRQSPHRITSRSVFNEFKSFPLFNGLVINTFTGLAYSSMNMAVKDIPLHEELRKNEAFPEEALAKPLLEHHLPIKEFPRFIHVQTT